MQSTITRAPMTVAAGRGRAPTLSRIGKAAVALAMVGGLLLWLAGTKRAEAPPATAPDIRSEGQADAAPRPAGDRVREWEDWHGNWFVSPRRGDGPSR